MSTQQEIEGQMYSTGQLNAKEQFHVARRLAPIIAGMQSGPSMYAGLADAVSKLPDADVDYVMRMTMKTVRRKTGDQWAPVWNTAADQPQFADMSAGVLLQLMIIVIQDNLGGFTVGPEGSGLAATSPFGLSGRLN